MKKLRSLLLSGMLICSLHSIAQTTVVDSFVCGGIYRSYRLYIPPGMGTTAHPLILNLHGYTSNAAAQQTYSNFGPIADTAKFFMVFPQGTMYGGQPYWNAGLSTTGVDDIQFLSNLIDTLSAHHNIDQSSVYSTGLSNGGYMSHTLACALNNKIAAIASVAGSIFPTQYSTCSPTRPVPVMQISGTGDGTVPYNGNSTTLPIDTVVKYWVTHDHCNPTAAFSNVPNINTSDGCTAEHYVYSGGYDGSSVELYKIIGGGHSWPGSPYIIGVTNEDFNASEKIWLFFRKYKLNTLTGINDAASNDISSSVFPNPASSTITISAEHFVSAVILDVNGRVVARSNSREMNISSLAKGIYSVMIVADNRTSVKKLVKL